MIGFPNMVLLANGFEAPCYKWGAQIGLHAVQAFSQDIDLYYSGCLLLPTCLEFSAVNASLRILEFRSVRVQHVNVAEFQFYCGTITCVILLGLFWDTPIYN